MATIKFNNALAKAYFAALDKRIAAQLGTVTCWQCGKEAPREAIINALCLSCEAMRITGVDGHGELLISKDGKSTARYSFGGKA